MVVVPRASRPAAVVEVEEGEGVCERRRLVGGGGVAEREKDASSCCREVLVCSEEGKGKIVKTGSEGGI